MGFETARAAIMTALDTGWKAAHPSVDLVPENHELVDFNSRQTPFVGVQLRFQDADQASLDFDQPLSRIDGELLLFIHVKQGKGTAGALAYADTLHSLLNCKNFSRVQMHELRVLPASEGRGWWWLPVACTFHFHT